VPDYKTTTTTDLTWFAYKKQIMEKKRGSGSSQQTGREEGLWKVAKKGPVA